MSGDVPDAVTIHPAMEDDLPAIRNVVDGAALEISMDVLRSSIAEDDVLLATARGDRSAPGRVLGALVLDGNEIVAIAVRRRRRDMGIGTALVGAARERRDTLVAKFDPAVRAFWTAVGFTVEPLTESERLRGHCPGTTQDSNGPAMRDSL